MKVSWQKIMFQLPINNLCISYFYSSRNIVKPDTKYLFRNYLIDSFAAFTEFPSELDPLMIYDAMTVTCCSITTKMERFIQNHYCILQAEWIYRDHYGVLQLLGSTLTLLKRTTKIRQGWIKCSFKNTY